MTREKREPEREPESGPQASISSATRTYENHAAWGAIVVAPCSVHARILTPVYTAACSKWCVIYNQVYVQTIYSICKKILRTSTYVARS